MTSIERTAYPRLKRRPSAQELADVYTPTTEDLGFIRATARGPSPTLTLAVLLKVFQRLGHMPRLQDVPFAIVAHIRASLRLPAETALDVTPRTLYRHHEQIRTHLQVRSWGPEARRATIVAVHQAAQVMDHPADLINVAIEELVRQRFELPAFSTLETLTTHVRAVVHHRLFGTVLGRLSDHKRRELDALLETDQLGRSAFNALKRAPKQPSLSHLDDLVGHVRWLQELGDPADLLAGVPPVKVQHFAAEARSLDAAELKDITAPKRYTLLLSLISRAQVQGRDDLAEMFAKRMARIETHAKDELALIRERQRETTETLVGAFADVLQVLDHDPGDVEAGRLVKQAVARHGDVRGLLASCEAIAAYHGGNYLPLMWRFYRSHRRTRFKLAHTLQFISTTQDTSVLDALDVLLANEDRTGDLLPATVDLGFASEQWQRTVLVRAGKGPMLARRHFEVCVFTALAAALKAGDVAVEGSDAYADYREQLLPWSECEPRVPAYCQAVELPTTAAAFVEQLQDWLATTARRVDAALPSSGQVVITDKGEPVLKRGPRRQPSASAQALEAALLESHARAQHPGHAGQRCPLDELAEAVAAQFGQHPDAAIIVSFPGLGDITGARLLAEIGDDRTRFADARGLKAYAGAAPVTRASGKSLVVLHRRIKNRRLAAVGYVWTFAALRTSPGARAHYDRRRAAADRHAAAQRHLFNRFLGCLYHCLQTGQLYNEERAFPAALDIAA